MNGAYAKWFGRVMALGILVNLGFILPALFAPDVLLGWLGLPPNEAANPWLGNIALLLIQASAFYVPAALAPLRYPVYAWLAVVCRLLVSLYWLKLSLGPEGAAFRGFFVTDLAFSVVAGLLLHLALPPESQLSAANLRRGAADVSGWLRERFRSTRAKLAVGIIAVVLAVVGLWLWDNLLRARPDVTFSDPAEQFKHGAIGLGFDARVPYWLFKVLPDVCPDRLPGGWASLGLLYEPGQDLPVGFARRQIGFPSVEPNCALCHTASYRTELDGRPQLILGGPAHELDLQGFQRFLYGCAADPRFTPANVLARVERLTPLSFGERLAYRLLILPFAKRELLKQRQAYAWQDSRPTQGRGRTDTFNPTKFNVFHMPDDHTIGTVDLPATWNQRPREGLWLHWDGNNNQIRERNYAAAMAIGATPRSVLVDSFKRVTDFLLDLPPPKFPFPLDAAKAARGQALYQSQCAACHAFGTPQVGQVTPITTVTTDRHRLDSFTEALVERFHQIDDPPFRFDAYRKTDGYSNLPIDGCWARSPYLHNGSVPTLWDLLQPEQRRARVFYRGYNVYDPVKLGYVSDGPEAARAGFRYDTSVEGNANTGHAYGTALSEAEKWDLIEFLKTL
jgi:mono/diheme cytochrome c family protein